MLGNEIAQELDVTNRTGAVDIKAEFATDVYLVVGSEFVHIQCQGGNCGFFAAKRALASMPSVHWASVQDKLFFARRTSHCDGVCPRPSQ
jgi:hypothetical protein